MCELTTKYIDDSVYRFISDEEFEDLFESGDTKNLEMILSEILNKPYTWAKYIYEYLFEEHFKEQAAHYKEIPESIYHKKMEELFNLLYGRSFPVYIVFDATRSRLLDRDWGYEVDSHSYSICKERFEKLNKGDADIGFFNSYSNMQAFENFRRAEKDEKWGMAVTLADTVINHDVTIPVSQARFFVRDDATSDKFALKQVKLSEVLTKQVQENEDF